MRVRRLVLRMVVSSFLSIFIGSPVDLRDLARPVAVSRMDRGGPFQGIGLPGIGVFQGFSFDNRDEEVEEEDQLNSKGQDGDGGDEDIEGFELVEGDPAGKVKI